jgi:hypothetical protein
MISYGPYLGGMNVTVLDLPNVGAVFFLFHLKPGA